MITCRKVWHRFTHRAAPAHHAAHPARHAHHVRHAWHASVVCKYVGAGALALGLGTGGGALIGGGMPALALPAGWVPSLHRGSDGVGYLPNGGNGGTAEYHQGGAFDLVHRSRVVNPKGPQNVPEPSSIAVFAVGAVAAFAARRRG